MGSKLVKLPLELIERCERFARRSVAGYGNGEKGASLYYSTHGIEHDVPGQAVAKMAECAFCRWADLEPLTAHRRRRPTQKYACSHSTNEHGNGDGREQQD